MFLSRGWSRADLAEAVTRASVEVELSSSATSLHDTIGVLLVGNFIGLFLYGLTLYQAYRYACVFPNDAMWLKAIVALEVLLETISSGLGVHTCIYYLVTNYGHPEVLEHRVWSFNLYPLLSGLTMVVSQSFFIRRLWFFEPRYRPIVSVAGVCSLAQLGVFIAATTEMFAANGTTDIRTLSRLWPIGFTLALGSDVLLTALLVYTLHRSRTGMKRTDKMIDVLIVYTAKTGLMNGIVDLLTVISAFVRPNSYIYVALGLCGARVYAITLLSALHSRREAAGHGWTSWDAEEYSFGVYFATQQPTGESIGLSMDVASRRVPPGDMRGSKAADTHDIALLTLTPSSRCPSSVIPFHGHTGKGQP